MELTPALANSWASDCPIVTSSFNDGVICFGGGGGSSKVGIKNILYTAESLVYAIEPRQSIPIRSHQMVDDLILSMCPWEDSKFLICTKNYIGIKDPLTDELEKPWTSETDLRDARLYKIDNGVLLTNSTDIYLITSNPFQVRQLEAAQAPISFATQFRDRIFLFCRTDIETRDMEGEDAVTITNILPTKATCAVVYQDKLIIALSRGKQLLALEFPTGDYRPKDVYFPQPSQTGLSVTQSLKVVDNKIVLAQSFLDGRVRLLIYENNNWKLAVDQVNHSLPAISLTIISCVGRNTCHCSTGTELSETSTEKEEIKIGLFSGSADCSICISWSGKIKTVSSAIYLYILIATVTAVIALYLGFKK